MSAKKRNNGSSTRLSHETRQGCFDVFKIRDWGLAEEIAKCADEMLLIGKSRLGRNTGEVATVIHQQLIECAVDLQCHAESLWCLSDDPFKIGSELPAGYTKFTNEFGNADISIRGLRPFEVDFHPRNTLGRAP